MPRENMTAQEREKLHAQAADNVQAYEGIKRGRASYYEPAMYSGTSYDRTHIGTDPNISVKSDYGRNDYDYYRLGEQIPTRQSDIIAMSMKAYDRVSIVHNIIDLMADFAMQGIRIVHPNKSIQKFHREWFKYIDGYSVSERFLNYLYRIANVVVKKQYGKISTKAVREWRKSIGVADNDQPVELPEKHKVIPTQYNFLNPLSLDVIGGDLAVFIGKPVYVLKVTQEFARLVKESAKYEEYGMVVPPEIKEMIMKGARSIPLDPDKVSVYYYRKDDWLQWANPMTYSVLNALLMLEKMHLADLSALDGVISNIRLWNLGHLDGINSIMPTRAAINKLRNILANNVGGGTIDLVWGPELKFSESNTQVHHFLGPEKYQQIMSEIFMGYGIPASLTGGGAGSQGYTNNFVSMKTLIERLRYGRSILTNFWDTELKLVQKTMGFAKPATVVYDDVLVSDEAAYKNLLIAMADRNWISEEELRERFGVNDEVEVSKIRREQKIRDKGKMPPKAGPYFDGMKDEQLKSIVLQNGGVAPSEVGVNLKPRKEGERSPQEMQNEHQQKIEEFKAKQKNGRPAGKKDGTKRKTKTVKPRTSSSKFVNDLLWANAAQEEISDMVLPAMLHAYGKKDVRALTEEEKKQLELTKYSILTNLTVGEAVTPEKVYTLLASSKQVPEEVLTLCNLLTLKFVKQNARGPSLDEVRQIQASAFVLVQGEGNGEDSSNT